MATLTVTATHDYSGDTLTNIDSIVFTTSSGATASFNSNQFGPGLISNNVAISGDSHQNVIQVVAPGVFSAAQWTFSNWGSSDQQSLFDGVVIAGSPEGGNDTITGSSQSDEIRASSSESGNNEGADSLSGGAGDDVFRIHRGSSYTLFDGGTGTDTIWVSGVMVDNANVDLSNSTIVSVERLRLAASHSNATLRGDQIGGPGKIQEVEGYPPGPGLNVLTVNGDHVDLSTVTFVNSGQIVHINGTSASGNTLIGSSQSDIINAFDGSSGDVLDGRGGSDTLTGGSGDDRYIYSSGYSTDTIVGFVAGAGTPDKIDLTGIPTVHNLADVLAVATQSGANTVFNFSGGDTLTLQNIQKTALAADDFIFKQLADPSPDAFNGSRHDILWQNDNGSVGIWDNGQASTGHVTGSAPSSWHVAGSGDYDGNGHTDILWRNDDGSVGIWDNGQGSSGHVTGSAPSSWHIAGSGDFDGNGHSDILWRNDDGSVAIWDNGQGSSGHVTGSAPSSWHIAGSGDFDGNGHSDILWRNDNGSVAIWDNGQGSSGHVVVGPGGVADSWHIAGTGDFDGNGHTDILWHNDNGSIAIWDNGQASSGHVISNAGAVTNDWHIV